ncbi:MAG: SbcC/MukB-like Walker B domain-containing protein, partial [Pseudomonadota bacterium]
AAEEGRHAYRARWEARRARGRPDGAFQPATMQLIDLETATPLTEKLVETRTAIEARVGLTFEQFKRSALLAQGDFEAFLSADPKDRALLLERITGGALFGEISKAAHARAAIERNALEALEAGAAAHQILEEGDRAEAERRAQATATRKAEATAAVDRLEAVEAHLREVERLDAARAAAEGAEAAAERAARLALGAAAAGLAAESEALRETQARLAREEAAAPWGARLASRADDALAALVQKTQAERSLAAAEDRMTTAREAVERSDEARATLLQAQRETTGELNAAAEALALAQEALDGLDPETAEAVGDAANAAGQALAELQLPLGRWRAAREAAMAAVLLQGQRRAAARDTARVIEAAQAALPAAEVTVAEAEAKLQRWRDAFSETANNLRAGLAEGAPCPVCGATDHPLAQYNAAAEPLLHAARAAASEEEERRAKAVRSRDALLQRLERNRAEHEAACERADAAGLEIERQDAAAASARREARRTLSRWADLADRMETPALAAAAAAIGRALKGGRPTAPSSDDPTLAKVAEATGALERPARAAMDGAKARVDAVRAARLTRDGAEAARRAAEDRARRAAEDLAKADARRRRLSDEIEAAERDGAAARERLAGPSAVLDRALDGLASDWRERAAVDLEALITREAEGARRRAELWRRINARAPALETERQALVGLTPPGWRLDTVPSRENAGPADLAAASAAMDALARAETRAESARGEAERLRAAPPAGAEPFSADQGDETSAAARRSALAEAQETARGVLTERAAEAETAALALREDDAARRRLGAALEALEARRAAAKVWLQLDDLIGAADGGKFRRFAQSITLETLAALATRRLAHLAPRYALETAPGDGVDTDLALFAIDRDMADARRAVRQLSGGERFLTSLALALALADLSSEQGVVVESLFIDEGFGALDGESLGLALSALEMLQATGRQIGVVTHVEALSDRIAAQIRVTPEGGGRSSVRVVDL